MTIEVAEIEAVEYVVRPRYRWVAEASAALPDEATLSRLWAAQTFPAEALTLVNGRRLRVILPGRPGTGPGPDFRDAIVAIDGIEVRGDIELHVRAGSFIAHGHHRDAAYNNVVLHVVYTADGEEETTLLSGRRVPVAQFAPWIRRRSGEIEGWLAAAPLWQEPCSDAVNRLGRAEVLTVLATEGQRRFLTRVARLKTAIAELGEEQALWSGLLDAMGYGSDRAAWRRLAELLPARKLRMLAAAEPDVAVPLLAVAGLTSVPESLQDLLPRPLSPALQGGSRPLNRPERRLQAVAGLWQRSAGDLPGLVRQSVGDAATVRQLTGRWCVAAPTGGPALLGAQRANELLQNLVLPFAACDPGLTSRALELAAALPAVPGYGRTQFLETNLRRSEPSLRFPTAQHQQGLLSMVSDWCRQGGCGRCPLS